MMFGRTIAMVVAGSLMCGSAAAELVFRTSRATLVIGQDAAWGSLRDKASGRQLVPEGAKVPLAVVQHGGQSFAANAVELDADRLTLRFAGIDTVLSYAVHCAPDWIVFRLQSVAGTRPDSLTLIQTPVAIAENVGRRLNAAWDAQTVVCLMAANRPSDCRPRAGRFATLTAATQDAPGPRIEGAAAALIVCPTPEFKAIAREASHAFGLLTNEDDDGTPVKDTELVRGSYWFMSFGEAEVDKVIEYCRRTGIRQVMLSSGAWCSSPGHYRFNERLYPGGRESLKRTVERLHEHGILVGMHCFASKIAKHDPYVTPVPDKRLLRGVSASWRPSDGLLELPLAEDIDAGQTEIPVAGDLRYWPGSSAVADRYWEGGVDKHREVTIGDEIVQYQEIGPEGVWDTFLGCRRGAWGTAAAAHRAGQVAYHVGVDGCINGYIIDQRTDLMDEVAQRLADIFNDCGFDMVYFDGGEDVDRRRFDHYVANFQDQVVRRFTRRPLLHMGTIMNHLLWHSFARSSTVDHYLNTLGGAIVGGRAPTAWPTVKEHIDRSVAYMLAVQQDMMPGELGWFGIWPGGRRVYTARIDPEQYAHYREMGCKQGPVPLPGRENTRMTGELIASDELRLTVDYDGLQFDEIEYLMGKSLGHDVPISLQTSFGAMEAHVLTPEILNIVREYEALRMTGAVSEEVRARLREPGRDFLLVRHDGDSQFLPVETAAAVGGDREMRAMVGTLGDGSIASLWHTLRDGNLLLALNPERLRLVDLSGGEIEFASEAGRAAIPIGPARNLLIARDARPDELLVALENAELRAREPEMIFVRAAEFSRIEGHMARGSEVGVQEAEALGDVLVCTDRPAVAAARSWYAEYTVNIPREGRWAIWGRVRYPSGSDDSFGFVVPGEQVTLAYADGQILGNCGVAADRWHWTGRGSGSSEVPPGQPLTRTLPAGRFTFRIYAREGPGTAARNPLLDLICLTEDPTRVPTDDDARQRLGL